MRKYLTVFHRDDGYAKWIEFGSARTKVFGVDPAVKEALAKRLTCTEIEVFKANKEKGIYDRILHKTNHKFDGNWTDVE